MNTYKRSEYGDTWDFCPECAITMGVPRQHAFDTFFLTGHMDEKSAILPARVIVKHITINRMQDPTAASKLACGHTVF